MKTTYPLAVVIAMVVVGLMFGLSGFDAGWGHSSDSKLVDHGQSAANDSVVNDGSFNSSAKGDDQGSIVGFIVTGTGEVFNAVALVLLLPLELENKGFPFWFAYPVGLAVQILLSFGVVQFGAGRVFR